MNSHSQSTPIIEKNGMTLASYCNPGVFGTIKNPIKKEQSGKILR
jgi:hypothetical protein